MSSSFSPSSSPTMFYITHMHQAARRLCMPAAQRSIVSVRPGLCSFNYVPARNLRHKFSALLCRQTRKRTCHIYNQQTKHKKKQQNHFPSDWLHYYEIEDSLKILVIKVSLIKFIMHFNSFEWLFQPNDSFNVVARMDCNLIWHVFFSSKQSKGRFVRLIYCSM